MTGEPWLQEQTLIELRLTETGYSMFQAYNATEIEPMDNETRSFYI